MLLYKIIKPRFDNRRSVNPLDSKYQKNEQIRSEKVRLIVETGENIGVVDTRDALARAKDLGLDLILISPNQEIPVARIIDWSKFKYLQNKKQKNNKSKAGAIKEWWFKPKIADYDITTKLENIKKFLKKGGRAKLTVKFIGRTNYEDMTETMRRLKELSTEFVEPTSEVTKEGRNLVIFVKLKTNDKAKNS